MRSHPLRPRHGVRAFCTAFVVLGALLAFLNAALGVGGKPLASVVLPLFGELVLTGAVAAIALRASRLERDRAAWTVLGCGAFCWLAGDIYRLIAFPDGAHRFFPSPADAGYLLLYPFAYVGLWLLIRGRATRFQRSLWLDGLIGATGVAALGASLVVGFVLRHTGGSFSTVATNVAYPLADVLLLAQLVAAIALSRGRPGRTWLFIGTGLATFAVADSAYAYTSAMGHTYVLAIGPLWIVAYVLIAMGAWQEERPPVRDMRLEGTAVLAVPMTFALLATSLLAYGQAHHLPNVAAELAVTTLVLVMVRVALTLRENSALLDSRKASLTDEFTGLPNRRRLNEQIRSMVQRDSRLTLAGLLLVDLDGCSSVRCANSRAGIRTARICESP
jgi:hypothetical protein